RLPDLIMANPVPATISKIESKAPEKVPAPLFTDAARKERGTIIDKIVITGKILAYLHWHSIPQNKYTFQIRCLIPRHQTFQTSISGGKNKSGRATRFRTK